VKLGDDEMGMLTDSFNLMLAQIQELNRDLERRVNERTAQLEAANLELSRGRAQLKSFFESLPGLFLILTPDLKIVTASDAYLKATMTTREGIIGRDLFEVLPDNPDDPGATGGPNLRASLERVRQSAAPDTMAIQRYDVRRPDGSFEEHYWSPINAPVLGPERQVEYIIHRVEEVTEFVKRRSQPAGDPAGLQARMEQMEAEIFQRTQAVQTANRQLQVANRELEAFSYSVSHDLRAPLRHIDGFAQLLGKHLDPALDDTARRYLTTITSSAKRLGVLIDELLVFSRMGRTELHRTAVDTRALIDEVVRELQPEAQGRRIEWRIDALPVVQADPVMWRQVWSNLLGNALKYSRRREIARIEITHRSDATDGHVFAVRDNGAGFQMEYAGKLFGVFQRLHNANEFEGTGIGLANVRRIVERHGGRVWAEGRPDEGATFSFSLPAANPVAGRLPPTSP
jgi:signal transduction histidine kinase